MEKIIKNVKIFKRPSRATGEYFKCKYCGKLNYVNKKRVGKVIFCDKTCYFKYKNEIYNPLKGFKHSELSKEHYKNKIFTKQHRENLSKASKGKIVSDITKEKIRQNTIKQHVQGLFPQTNTLIERIMNKALRENNISFKHPFPFGRFVCDFAIPEKKIIIECDGDYWHNREDIKKKDKAKNAYLKVSGWVLLRFWEHEIKDDINKCVQIIQEEICKT